MRPRRISFGVLSRSRDAAATGILSLPSTVLVTIFGLCRNPLPALLWPVLARGACLQVHTQDGRRRLHYLVLDAATLAGELVLPHPARKTRLAGNDPV